jgi:dihydroxyacid dehydratase/phosphogluconate dehydratase
LLEGPARAPARSYLRNIGYTAQQLSQPIVGVSHSWTDTLPGNINHRDLAARSRPRRAAYQRNGALAHYALLVSSASHGAVPAGLDDADDNQAGA